MYVHMAYSNNRKLVKKMISQGNTVNTKGWRLWVTIECDTEDIFGLNDIVDSSIPARRVGSGYGFGCRDYDWEFSTEKEAQENSVIIQNSLAFSGYIAETSVWPINEEV